MPPFSGKKKKEQLQAKRQRKRDEEERANALERERAKLHEELLNRGEHVSDDVLEAYMRERHPQHHDPARGQRAHRREREQNVTIKEDEEPDKSESEVAATGADNVDGGVSNVNPDIRMYSADRHHGVRSIFAKESPAVLAARKRLSYQPIPFRTTMPVKGIPFNEWFTFPSKTAQPSSTCPPNRANKDAELSLSMAEKAALISAAQEHSLDRPLVATTAEALGGGSGSLVFPFSVELPSRGWHVRDRSSSDGVSTGVEVEPNMLTVSGGGAVRSLEVKTGSNNATIIATPRALGNKKTESMEGKAGNSTRSSMHCDQDEGGNTEFSHSADDDDKHGANSASAAAAAQTAEARFIKDVEQTRFDIYVRCLDSYPLPPAIAGLEISSYERNLEVWQQLWRTVELSDVLVVVADARYPILHAHLGLLTYITKVQRKPCVFVLNKEDLVPTSTLRCWQKFLYRYLSDLGFVVEAPEDEENEGKVASDERRGRIVLRTFTTNPRPETAGQRDGDVDVTRRQKHRKCANASLYTKLRTGKVNATKYVDKPHQSSNSDSESEASDKNDELRYSANENFIGMQGAEHALQHDRRAYKELEVVAKKITELMAVCRRLGAEGRAVCRDVGAATTTAAARNALGSYATSSLPCPAPRAARKNKKMRKRSGIRRSKNKVDNSEVGAESAEEESLDAEEDRAPDSPGYVHIGFIGHPNVGKSSLLNCIRGTKVVSVSATPGHTKHIQTIPVPEEKLTLVDSPGLALPVFGVPRPLQAVLGTHQISQTRDPQSGVSFLAAYLPIEKLYGLLRPDYAMTEDEWSSYELCEAYAKKRGYYVKHGKGALDIHRAAIAILQEAYEGRLALFYAPPELNLLQSAWYRERIRPHLLLSVFGPPLL